MITILTCPKLSQPLGFAWFDSVAGGTWRRSYMANIHLISIMVAMAWAQYLSHTQSRHQAPTSKLAGNHLSLSSHTCCSARAVVPAQSQHSPAGSPLQTPLAVSIFDFTGKLPTSYCIVSSLLITTEYFQGNTDRYFPSALTKTTKSLYCATGVEIQMPSWW